jgi:hypothetical protein
MKRPAPIKPRNILAAQLWQNPAFRPQQAPDKRKQATRKPSKHQLHRDAHA